jgi:predicted cupin superfamily sugar epimerase
VDARYAIRGMTSTARQLIAALKLEPLPREGGFFRQTWRSEAGSAILFLITAEQFSALHRIAQDELWHFHAGDPVEHVQLDPRDGRTRVTRLGGNVLAGEQPQLVVPRGTWQGARLEEAPGATAREPRHGFALLGCTLTPPWDERGFELADRGALERAFPENASQIRALTR